MMRTLRTVSIALLLASCGWLSACSSAPPKPKPMKIDVVASADVNPDAANRASPVVVRIYQLKDDATFKDADFFALYDKEQATLAASLISRDEFELAPGEHRTVDFTLSPDTHFLGVAAAFRDIRNAQWRGETGGADKALMTVLKKNKISVNADRASVSIKAE